MYKIRFNETEETEILGLAGEERVIFRVSQHPDTKRWHPDESGDVWATYVNPEKQEGAVLFPQVGPMVYGEVWHEEDKTQNLEATVIMGKPSLGVIE
jgi:hypothetical protein